MKEMYAKHFLVTDDFNETISSNQVTSHSTCTAGSDADMVENRTASLKSTEEAQKSNSNLGVSDLSTGTSATEEPLAKRCRRLSLTIDEEMADIQEAGLTSRLSRQNSQQQTQHKRNSKAVNANVKTKKKSFVPAKVRKIKID